MKKALYGCLAVVLSMAASCSKSSVEPDTPVVNPPGGGTTAPTVSTYLTKATETHNFVVTNLKTSYNSYRVNTTTDPNSAFEWYNASQIYADAAMIAAGDASYLTEMNQSFKWMENMWDKSDPKGGYFAFAHLDGSGSSGTKYVDDNSLTGMAYLDAYEVTSGTDKAAYLDKAKQCANWLIQSGLFDATYGGGFWWNTERKVKPTQTNGVALQLFSKLYVITSDKIYLDWATSVNTWLNSKMYDSATGLYVWQFEETGIRNNAIFTYDNAIMVEAFLLYAQATKDNSYVSKAQAVGNSMNRTLWDAAHNVYIFNTSDRRVTPAWCGWGTQAMIKLYQTDNNAMWLTYAKGNIDGINTILRNPANNGYFQFAGLDGAGKYTNYEGVDQAWMQRLQVMLSKYK
jgi:uncharacterized protein YyaL (SSP411 family)